MQKISFFLRRDSAKLVPIVRVAGSAGGTTIVIRSSARTMIKCQASYAISSVAESGVNKRDAHMEPNKINHRRDEANTCNSSHDGYVTKRVLIKLEARRFWEEH